METTLGSLGVVFTVMAQLLKILFLGGELPACCKFKVIRLSISIGCDINSLQHTDILHCLAHPVSHLDTLVFRPAHCSLYMGTWNQRFSC